MNTLQQKQNCIEKKKKKHCLSHSFFNLFFHFVGVLGWLVVGVMWHDRALMVVISVAAMIFFMGILNYYFGGAYP